MTLTSLEFLAFFVFVLFARQLFGTHRAERWFLLGASVVFALASSTVGTAVVVIITVVDFCIGRALERSTDGRKRKRLLRLSLGTSLGLLGVFKYTGFIFQNAQVVLDAAGVGARLPSFSLPSPPGISFFTFASISYVVDVYNRRIKPADNLADYGLFLGFFPKFLAGPIARASSFLPQIRGRRSLAPSDIETALAYILIGAVKKLVIADQVVGHVDLIFASPGRFDSLTLFQGAFGYAVQIYCDFSGYSDIAVGVARLLGFKLPDNFQMPFSAPTITDYWRRWHITMSSWFRDYLFLPLEMARKRSPRPTLRTTSNLLLTWLVCGLWHGAAWNFVCWGGIHGAAMAAHVGWRKWSPFTGLRRFRAVTAAWTVVSHALTLGVVLVSSVYFRAPSVSSANGFLVRLLRFESDGTRMLSPYILPAVAAVAFLHFVFHRDGNWAVRIVSCPAPVRFLAYGSLACVLVLLGATSTVPFVYFRF